MVETGLHPIEIEDVKRLVCHAGDTVLFGVPDNYTSEDCRDLHELVSSLFDEWHPGVHVLVLQASVSIEVIPATTQEK